MKNIFLISFIRPSAVQLALGLLLFTLSCSNDVPSSEEYQKLINQNSSKSFNIGYWGNIRGYLKECGCSFTPLGGFKRRERALEKLAAEPKYKDALYFDFGHLLSPSMEPLSKKSAQKILSLTAKQASAGINLDTEDESFITKNKLTIPADAKIINTNNEPRTIKTSTGIDLYVWSSDEESTLSFEKIKKHEETQPPNSLNLILNSGKVTQLNDLSNQLKNPFVVIGASQKIEGALCYSIKKGLFCYGIWEGKAINFIKFLKPPQDIASKATHWIDADTAMSMIQNFKENKANMSAKAIEEFQQYFEDYTNGWQYKLEMEALDKKRFGEND